ncbi:MAG: hypothetical protein WD844_10490 [Thermoleophilaceae bacterium]
MRRSILTACLAVAALGAFVPGAGAQNPFRAIVDDWRADGHITPCKYTADQLNATLNLPGDIEQYAPGLIDQIQAALQTLAAGGCDEQPEPEPVEEAAPAPAPAPPPSAPTPEPVVEVAEPPAPEEPARNVLEAVAQAPAPPVAASGSLSGAEAPAPVWLLGMLAAAAALAGLAALVAWFFGWSAERLTRPLAAATAEAGGRGADVFAEFRDWLRIGR